MNSDKDFMFASIIILFMVFGCLQVEIPWVYNPKIPHYERYLDVV